MKRTNSFFVAAAIVAAMTFGLSSCNPDVQLGSQENIPEVAEHLLGMSVQEAMQYLEKQGFIFGSKADYTNEYVFSRDASLTEFSYEATAMLMFGTFEGDTVRYADGMQCPKTEQEARDLYWKWSHYTAGVTLKEVERWDGDLVLKDLSGSSLKNKWMSYIDGSSAKQMLDSYRDKYEKGELSKEEYDMWLSVYSQTKERFWTDFKSEGENINSASEHYTDYSLPKEVELIYDANNGGRIELHYETHNFVRRWE